MRKNRKYGFTLIELLAVIVILAIIALIATPIVINIIKDSKENATLRSADFYLDAVEFSIAQRVLESKSIPDNTYKIMSNGNICLGTLDKDTNACNDEMIVEVNGEVPTEGTITIESGEISDVAILFDNKAIIKDSKENLVYAKTYKNGEAVYYNVDTGEVCAKSEAVSTTGTKEGCMKFYAFNDVDGNATVNLILDHNTTAQVAWNSSGTNVDGPGPREILTTLYSDTKDWLGTETPEDYTMIKKIRQVI